ncbi:MAG: NAD(+)/NADH kinase [Simkaniaceae bacterium]|nr:MAG: NAD(+)/NADH kinase [Simkaniaceae bacterium]
MKIALFPKIQNDESKKLALQVIEFLSKNGVSVVVEDDKASELGMPSFSSTDPQSIDILITMGGDGSILRIAHQYSDLNAAILGINLGHLGFMADVQISEIIPCLEDLLNGSYTIQERTMIDGKSNQGDCFFAINDCVLHRARNPSLVEIAIYVDDLLLNNFEADGVILATSTGSTAYSLAAGGPILSPEIDAFVLTPICPHTISYRPIVINPKQDIRIEYVSKNQPIEFVTDGLQHFEMSPGDHVILKKSSKTFKLVNLKRIDYFSTLRHKLGWSGKLR